jgi:hypothetical protein
MLPPPELNDADTVLYEIYMLRFAAKRLVRERWEEPQDAWVYLEDFLVHYRNLIEFLGKQNNIRDTDLHVTTIWAKLGVPPPAGLARIHADGAKLWAEYEEGFPPPTKRSPPLHYRTPSDVNYSLTYRKWPGLRHSHVDMPLRNF